MKCKKAERILLRSFDGLLDKEEKEELFRHLKSCPSCERKRAEYRKIFETLSKKDFPDPKPYFWECLQAGIEENKKYESWSLWKRWSIRAVPLSLIVVIMLAASIVLFLPRKNEELSQSEILLLRNRNPFQETRTLLEEEGIESKNMMLIFASIDETNGIRRYSP